MSHSLALEQETYTKNILGFWAYIMSDCLIFATLFTTYLVLHHETFGGPSSKDLFNLNTALAETFALLFSSFASGLGMISARNNHKWRTVFWMCIAFLLGALFLVLEINEFADFYRQGHTWTKSAFLSSYFTLVGTHGFHVSVGLFWLIVMLVLIAKRGLIPSTFRRLVCFSMFWHFLDLVWIFILTIVYLMGVT